MTERAATGEPVRVDAAYALILDGEEERVLVVQDNGHWSLPGGAREADEMSAQTAIREAKEETGFDIAVGGIVHVAERFLGESHVLFVTFCGTIVGGEVGSADPEIGGIEWKTLTEAEQLIPYYRNIRGLSRRVAHYQVEPQNHGR